MGGTAFFYYRMRDLTKITGLSRAKIYELVKAGEFVPQTQLSTRCIGYRSDLVEAWLKDRPFRGGQNGGIAA